MVRMSTSPNRGLEGLPRPAPLIVKVDYGVTAPPHLQHPQCAWRTGLVCYEILAVLNLGVSVWGHGGQCSGFG